MSTTYKIHPAIGIARVGNSDDYYQAPKTPGGLPLEKDGFTTVSQFRDGQQRVRRQAAAFSIYAYDAASPQGRLINLTLDGIAEIEWTVHLANKKAAWREFLQLQGENGYAADHPYRNPIVVGDARKQLIIDPGPQTVRCVAGPYQADFARGKGQPGYPQTFPPPLMPYNIDTLGALQTNPDGSIFVVGGYGNSGVSKPYTFSPALLDSLPDSDPQVPAEIVQKLRPIQNAGYAQQLDLEAALKSLLTAGEFVAYSTTIINYTRQPRLDTYANNNYWFDDVSDGPVTATLVLKNGTRVKVDDPAWVLVAPPGYAPQIINMVTLYDTMYDVFVRNFGYNPSLYNQGAFQPQYQPNLAAEIQPILDRPAAYRWVAGINDQGVQAHGAAQQDPGDSNFFGYLRKPGDYNRAGRMPKLAGDNPLSDYDHRDYLTLTQTQYFLLSQFNNGQFNTNAPAGNTGDGEKLDRAALENCVGGPFCPGIEMTWISRNTLIYSKPFRLKQKKLTGTGLSLSEDLSQGLEPGDVSRYMALPWQADFNECSDQDINDTLIWWWPAQRPYQVYTQADPSTQVYWTRPAGDNFTHDVTMVYNWKDLGFIVQTPRSSSFLEVQRIPLEHPDSNG